MASGIIISQWWLWFFRPGGFANYLVSFLGIGPVKWLTERGTGLLVIALVAVAGNLGATTVLYTAVLLTVPSELHDMAQVDGAGQLRTWWAVDIPWISKTIWFVTLMVVIGGAQVYECILALTNGGPEGGTASILFNIWRTGILYHQYGVAACKSIMLMVVVGSGLWIVRRKNA